MSLALTLNPALGCWQLAATRSTQAAWTGSDVNVGAVVEELADVQVREECEPTAPKRFCLLIKRCHLN